MLKIYAPYLLKKSGGSRFDITHMHPLQICTWRGGPSFFISRPSSNSICPVSTMCDYSPAVTTFLLLSLSISIQSVVATNECRSDVSYPIKATLDNGKLFSTCAMGSAGVRIDAHSLFDVLQFCERDFLLFCRAPNCIKPVKTLLRSIPTNCLITYHGAAHNLSEEVSSVYRQCAKVVEAADKTDEDYVYRYCLD